MINSVLRIAHRGASGYEAENSIAALKKAIDFNVDIVEADVQLTKDEVPIIRHDNLLDRTTNTTGFIADYVWEDFEKTIRLKNGEKVSSLDYFCRTIAPYSQKLYLDIKCLDSLAQIIKIALSHIPAHRLLIGSFHHRLLPLTKKIHPEIKTIMILEGNPVRFKPLIEDCGCDIVGLGYDSMEQRSVDEMHALGKKVFSWTVNHPRAIQRAKEMGVDGITSDFPDRI